MTRTVTEVEVIDCSINQWRRRLQGVIQENVGHIEHVVQLADDICTLALLFVADVIRDELFAGVQHMIFPSCMSATVVLIVCGAI